MNLSIRLKAVSDTVLKCDTAADIGCDHGYVSIDLADRQIASRIIACDVNAGPLEAAKENIALHNLENVIETRLSDGLDKIKESDNVNAIIIAGMGGALMTRILEEGKEIVSFADQLILQPQSELFLVRKWLRNNGYNIDSEKMVKDAGKYYFIMDARHKESKEYEPRLQKIYDNYSEYLIKTKNAILKEYLQKGLENNTGYMAGIAPDRKKELQDKTELIKSALALMEA